jgi:putative spermidine/putrescine transport system permease protein
MRLGQISLRMVTAVTIVGLLIPIGPVIPMSFTSSSTLDFPPAGFSLQWYGQLFTDPVWQLRAPISLETAAGTAILATVMGTAAALGLARGRFGRWQGAMLALFLSPLIVPIVVVATGMFFVWALGWSIGPIRFGGGLDGTVPGLILAHTVLALPFPVVIVSASLRTVDRNLEAAAASLGAGPVATFRRVTLPIILPGVLASMTFAFLTSWDEVVVATYLSTARVSTIPVEIFTLLRESLDPVAAAVSTMLLCVSVALFGLVVLVRGRIGRHVAQGEVAAGEDVRSAVKGG